MKQLTPEELEQVSLMHCTLVGIHLNATWDFDLDNHLARLHVPGAVLKPVLLAFPNPEPITVLGAGTITISNWLHFEIFRRNPSVLRNYLDIGWATETRRPPNPITCPHHFVYHNPDMVIISGYGENPGAMYVYIFEDCMVSAEFLELDNQEQLRELHGTSFEERRHHLQNDPQDAALRIPLDEEDEEFLHEIWRKAHRGQNFE